MLDAHHRLMPPTHSGGSVCGSKLQTNGVKKQKARLEKIVLVNGWTSSGMADESRVQKQTCSVVRRFGKPGCEPCTLEVLTCMYVIAAGLETSAVAAWHRITSTPERNPSCIVLNSTVSELHAN